MDMATCCPIEPESMIIEALAHPIRRRIDFKAEDKDEAGRRDGSFITSTSRLFDEEDKCNIRHVVCTQPCSSSSGGFGLSPKERLWKRKLSYGCSCIRKWGGMPAEWVLVNWSEDIYVLKTTLDIFASGFH